MADRRPLVNVSGTLREMPSGDKVPVAALATGTPDGTKFVRDDGTLVTPDLYAHPNHTGDVTSAGDGATTIASDAVTNTKLANMAAATIKGRASGAGTGDPTDLTATQVRTIINVAGTATADTIPVRDASGALTGLLMLAGSAGAPGLAVAGDPDTGIYGSATNALSVAAAGALAATFNAAGIYTPNRLGVGTGPISSGAINIGAAVLAGAGQYGILNQPTFSSAATTQGMGYYAYPTVEDSAFTMGALYAYRAAGFVKGAAATVSVYYAFSAADEGEAAVNYAFYGGMSASGATRWNLYMANTAPNYLNGKTYIGGIYAPLTATLATDGRLNVNTSYASGTAYEAGVSITNYRASGSTGAVLDLAHSRSNTVGANTAVGSAAVLARIRFLGADGTNFVEAARIDCVSDGTVSSGVVPGYLRFAVADDLGAMKNRLLLDYSGVLWVAQDTQRGPALTVSVPAKMRIGASAYTDTTTSASGTVTHGVGTSIPSFQIAASNTGVTYTTASTLYVSGAPTAGTNVTITNPYSVYVGAGKSYFGGDVNIVGTALTVNALTASGYLNVARSGASTNTVSPAISVSNSTTGTRAVGLGVGINFVTGDGSWSGIVGKLEVESTDWTSSSEDFDLSLKLMAAGTTGEVLRVSKDTIRLNNSKTPASAAASGSAGQICWDTSYMYVCTATNTWKRAAISTW